MCSTAIDTGTHSDLGLSDKSRSGGHACACGTHGGHSEPAANRAGANLRPTDYLVAGMTCSHCVSSVTEELSALPGVEAVSVSLNAGGASTVSVASRAPLDLDAVRAAIEEAGYALADGPR